LTFEPARPSTYTPFMRRFTDERARDLADTEALYERVTSHYCATDWGRALPSVSDAIAEAVGTCCELPPNRAVLSALSSCQRAILALEKTIFETATVDFDVAVLALKEQVDLRRYLRAQEHFLANEDRVASLLTETLTTIFVGLIEHLPPIADAPDGLTVPLYALVPNLRELVDKVINTLCAEGLADAGLFAYLQNAFYENTCAASGVVPYEETKKRLVTVGESALPPEALLTAYLRNTPFLDLFNTEVPFAIEEGARFEHAWIVGGSGHGKTQALQYLIARDLDLVARGEASVIVIDSQSDLIRNIAGLNVFGPGEALDGKLCLIDPHDVEFPVALNLFDVNIERINRYSLLDRERLINGILELYDFVLGSLLSAELTQKQSVVFRYMMRAMLVIPNATIQTLRELVEPNGYVKYKKHLGALRGTARSFFETEFNSRQFNETKTQILRRLYGILENATFERMFSHPKNKLDVFKEMNAGKVILINTAKDLLKQEGSEIFGRFFIAMIAQAAQERAATQERLPCFVYIDEAADYFDENVALILEQARKYRVGLTLAHQYVGQLTVRLQESFAANTTVKMAGGVSDRDARTLAGMLRTKPEFIEAQGKGSFATFIRNQTPEAVSLRFPLGYVEDLPRMSPMAADTLKENIRGRYGVPWKEIEHTVSSQVSPEYTRTNPDLFTTDAAKDW
jgi:hypothetical protein